MIHYCKNNCGYSSCYKSTVLSHEKKKLKCNSVLLSSSTEIKSDEELQLIKNLNLKYEKEIQLLHRDLENEETYNRNKVKSMYLTINSQEKVINDLREQLMRKTC
jgi:hypothetical protein